MRGFGRPLQEMSSRGEIGARVGGKGSWRRKVKKAPSQSQEGEKLWVAAQRAGCRDIGEIDSASMIIAGREQALYFSKPELAVDMKANTYVIHGKPQDKPIVEVLTDLLSGIDLSKGKKAEEGKEDLGDIPENVDFSKAETPAEENKTE